MATEKDWVDILQALLTPTVAIFGSYIAYQQWHINKVRLKHELYDRRMAVYTKLMDYIGVILSEAHVNDTAFFDWMKKSYEGYFLFNDEIIKYFELINEKSRALRKVHRTMSTDKAKGDEQLWGNLSMQDEELQQWFEKQFNAAKEKFSPFLRLDK
jgi:hypothetical protein